MVCYIRGRPPCACCGGAEVVDRCASRHSNIDGDRGLIHDEWAEVTMPDMPKVYSATAEADIIPHNTFPSHRDSTWSEDMDLDYAQLELEAVASVMAEVTGTTSTEASIVHPRPSSTKSKSSLNTLNSTILNNRQRHADTLKFRFMKMSPGQGNTAAISEAAHAPLEFTARLSEGDGEVQEENQRGSCGFNVTMKRSPVLSKSAGQLVGMCHHFTWDGHHCVTAGFGSEHANRCAGHLHIVGAVPDTELCRSIGTHSAKCAKMSSEDVEVVCVAPARKRGRLITACNEHTCPYLGEGKNCPFSTIIPRAIHTIHL